MKKFFPLAALVISAFSITSCATKDYTCTCTYSTNGATQTTVNSYSKITKTEAEDKCAASANWYHTDLGNGVNYLGKTKITCKL